MYKEDLLWVWSVWGVLIIRNSRTPWQNQVNHLLYLWLWTVRLSIYQVESHLASLWPVAAEAGADTHYICMKKTCNQYEVWDWSQLSNPHLCPSVCPTGLRVTSESRYQYQVGVVSFLLLAQKQVLKYFIYISSRSAMIMKWVGGIMA